MSTYLYLFLNLGTISIPLLYSVLERKFHFIQYFTIASKSILKMAIPFLIWDALFTHYGVWGFNDMYFIGIKILKMPLEEWLFFFCIPYACLFTHEVLQYYMPNCKLSIKATKSVSYGLLVFASIALFSYLGRWYTMVNFTLFILLLTYAIRYKMALLQRYYPSFFLILIPFLLVNGILTGSFIERPVVWYAKGQHMGLRIATIPVEDAFYAFTMLFLVQLFFQRYRTKSM